MKDDYLVISKKRLESWLSDCRSNPENFMSGYLYEFGRSGFETLDLLKSQLEKAEEILKHYSQRGVRFDGEKAREYFNEKEGK